MPEWPVWTELKGRTDPSFKKTLKGGRDELTKFSKSQEKLGGAVGRFGKLLKGLFVVAAIKLRKHESILCTESQPVVLRNRFVEVIA